MPGSPERRVRPLVACLALVGAAGLLLLPGAGGAYLDRAPPGHTGGFGEPTCHTCHQGERVNDPEGSLTLSTPETFEAGQVYDLAVRLRHPALLRGGFQLSARLAGGPDAGRQAGELAAGPGAEVVDWQGVQYARHTARGADHGEAGEIRWELRWRAPGDPGSPVAFHVAANAGNYDDSELGDFVYVATAQAKPAGCP